MTSEAKYPEPQGFDRALDDFVPKAVDSVFKCFTENEDERVRAWAAAIGLDGLRQNMGRVIARQVRSTAEQFYQFGFHNGAVKRIAAAGPGERSLVSYDEKGRIKEMVKTPLTLQERLDLEKTTDASA